MRATSWPPALERGGANFREHCLYLKQMGKTGVGLDRFKLAKEAWLNAKGTIVMKHVVTLMASHRAGAPGWLVGLLSVVAVLGLARPASGQG